MADRLAGVLADAVTAVRDLRQRVLHLGEHLLDVSTHGEVVVRLLHAAALVCHVVADARTIVRLRLPEPDQLLINGAQFTAQALALGNQFFLLGLEKSGLKFRHSHRSNPTLSHTGAAGSRATTEQYNTPRERRRITLRR